MNIIKKYLCFFGIFFLMFSPHILIFGFSFKTVYLFVVLPGLIGAYNYFTKTKKINIEKDILFFMFLAFVYLGFISAIGVFADTTVMKQILMGFITFFAGYYFVNKYKTIYGDRYINRLFMDLNKAGIFHASIVIATFLSPSFKDFLYSFIDTTELSKRYLFGEVENVRFQGIVHSGFSFLSTTHALLLVIGIWGFYMEKKKYQMSEIIRFILGQILILISIILIGRTGLVVILLFLIALMFYGLKDVKRTFRVSFNSIKLLLTTVLITITLFLTINLSEYKKNIDYAFELVITYSETKEMDRSTADLIQHHFIFPKNPIELIFGTGNFGRSDSLPYIYSDVGYALFISGAGIFGMLIGFSFFFIGLYYAYKYRHLNLAISRFITVYFVALLILNLKDYYYIGYGDTSQIFFIIICILAIEIESKNEVYIIDTSYNYDKSLI